MTEIADPIKKQIPDAEQTETFNAGSLRNPFLAAILAWLIPGLGHWYQRRRAKAILFFCCITSIFVFGCYMGSDREYGAARVVYICWKKGETRLFFIPQAFIGSAAIPAWLQKNRVEQGNQPLWGGFMAPPNTGGAELPEGNPTYNDMLAKTSRYYELGTLFTVIAGFMNILVIFDAISGPVIEVETGKEKEKNKEIPEK
ncbi:MAG: hypothetical protein LBT05_13715 [Planctomycetaceae bacterium]|jgi:hypothetical protein|nr:hypothetical protein [Planctomycetaceae bacterium]